MAKQGDALVREACRQVAKEQGGTTHEAGKGPAASSGSPDDMSARKSSRDERNSFYTEGEWQDRDDDESGEKDDSGPCFVC